MDRIDIFQKLKRQEADAFSKLTSEERQVISQYQDRCKCESQISEENEGAKFTQIALHDWQCNKRRQLRSHLLQY